MRVVAFAGFAIALWANDATPTFSRDVAPILYRHCAGCHHAGAVAPFALVTYSDAAKRASLIAKATAQRYMPPWLPSAPHFQHERRLTDTEIATLQHWAAGGAPAGNRAATPAAPQFPEGWPLGPPGLEAEMTADYNVPAEGLDLYQCFVIPIPRAPERYVRAIDIQPGNTRVVHHALLFQDTTGTARRRASAGSYPCFGTPGFLPARGLGGWTPGKQPIPSLPGMAETLYSGVDLVLQV